MIANGVRAGVVALALACTGGAAWSKSAAREPEPITIEAINGAPFAEPDGDKPKPHKPRAAKAVRPDPLLIKAQVLLDRARFSPGAIDGRDGDNFRGALSAFATAQGLPVTGKLDRAVFDKLQATSPDPVAQSYTLTEDDVKGPFATIPPKLEEQRDLLSALNPDKPLDKAGTVITVAAVPPLERGKPKDLPSAPKVVRIEVDKDARRVQAFGEDGTLLRSYPASIGSEEKPAPTGSFKATRAAFDPWYTYNPKYAFKGVKTRRSFKIAPGPNNPVGLVWIDLSIPSYGIHGTPEPEKVGKTESHGCIRLTNWDARDLATHVVKNAKVDFLEK